MVYNYHHGEVNAVYGWASYAVTELPNTSYLELTLNTQFLGNSSLSYLLELNHLLELNMSHSDFRGIQIPELFGSFRQIKYLRLSKSNFSGIIPYQLGELTNLIELDLSQNQLTDLPKSLLKLENLEILDVSSNSMEGTLSEDDFSELKKLQVLDLSFNFLALNLTPFWIPPFRLNVIKLGNCKIGPHFPTWLRTQRNFTVLDLSCGCISDEDSYNLSSNFNNYPRVDISSNKFRGPLPLFPPNALILWLSDNKFGGSIRSICMVKYDNLVELDISNNQFYGQLPNCWENMKSLTFLSFADNNFFRELPLSLGSLTSLANLHFRNNNLTGELPYTLQNPYLRLIEGGGNKLTGKIPASIGKLEALAFLSLRQNNISGSIPTELCNLTYIQVLDLSENNISARIPSCFQNFTSLVQRNRSAVNTGFGTSVSYGFGDGTHEQHEYIDNTIVRWKRKELEYKKTLKYLKFIDLSSNKLVGNIPGELFHLKALASLNLSSYYLTGNIPVNIGEMEMLECFDISINKLSGEIPIGLAELHYLAVLNLSSNNLSGKIPKGVQLQSFDASAYAGNEKICGDPLPKFPSFVSTQICSVVQSLYQKHYISILLGFIFGFWGIVGALFFKISWGNACNGLLNKVVIWLFVVVTMSLSRVKRKLPK